MKNKTLDDMAAAGISQGSIVEVVLFAGSEYYNGYTPAPTVNMKGYDAGEDMKEDPGLRSTGYVRELSWHPQSNRLVLSSSLPQYIAVWYIDEKCIHSFEKLK